MKHIKYILLSAVVLGFTACNDVEDVLEANGVAVETTVLPELNAGNLDFSNYVALGNSLTAGVTDNALFIATQNNSYPNMLANKFAAVGGGDFVQAMTSDNYGGLSLGPDNGIAITDGGTRVFDPRLVFDGSAPAGLESVIGEVTVSTDLLNNPTGPFNNLGVPGARSYHLTQPGYGNLVNLLPGSTIEANPYAVRLTGATADATLLDLALEQSPTFVSLWIGANDVLSYSTSGGSNGALTDQATFDSSIDAIIDGLITTGAQGVVANIPYVTDIPFFTTVPYNPIPLDEDTANVVNSAYAAYNGGIVQAFAYLVSVNAISQEDADAEIAKRTISFCNVDENGTPCSNPVVIIDEALTDLTAINPALVSMRQTTENDLVVLLGASFIGTLADPNNPASVNGVGVPLADNWVLTETEIQEVISATDNFNAKLASAAEQADFAFFNANEFWQNLTNGNFSSNNFTPTPGLVVGGLFSLDAVHPTSRGYAIIANEFMRAIDAKYGSNFEASGNLLDIGDYPTNYSPTLE
jgi:lysophospholipase L1-like esterase